jgi:LVIVD repeat
MDMKRMRLFLGALPIAALALCGFAPQLTAKVILTNVAHVVNSVAGGEAHGLVVSGSYAYVANHTDGLRIYALGTFGGP